MTSDFKFSALWLFVVILAIFAIATYFLKDKNNAATWGQHERESFLSKTYDKVPFDKVVLDEYSSSNPNVYKLYDNIFFDRDNGNLIEADGDDYVAATTSGNTAASSTGTITSIKVYTPDGNTAGPRTVSAGNSVQESTISSMPKSYSQFMVTSTVSAPKKMVGVVTWGYDTFITVLDSTNPTPTYGFSAYFPYSSTETPKRRFYDIDVTKATAPTQTYGLQLHNLGTESANDTADGAYSTLTNYDASKQVIQICKGVRYDPTNGSLIVIQSNNTDIKVYERPTSSSAMVDPSPKTYPDANKAAAANTSKTIGSVDYAPYYLITPDRNYLVQYVAWGQQTVVSVIVNRNQFVYLYAYRFNNVGDVDSGTNIIGPGKNTNNNNSNNNNNNNNNNDASSNQNLFSDISEYYRWLSFWNTVANSSNPSATFGASNLVSKNSIVPPVCPTCPSCTGNGVCTSCGGQGGSGTQTGGGSGSNRSSGNLLFDAGSGTKQLLENTGSGATSLVRDAASGTAGLVKDAASGAAGLVKDTASGTVGLAKDTISGTIGLAKDTIGGIGDILGPLRPTQVSSSSNATSSNAYARGANGGVANGGASSSFGSNAATFGGNTSQPIPGIDPYSYFGAIPPKSSNYVPITANFSAFGR